MTDTPSLVAPAAFDWSDEARQAFCRASGLLRVPFLTRALNAALAADAPRLFEQWAEGMIATITTHPVLGGRVIRLTPDADGAVTLRLDADLLRFILFNELPEGLHLTDVADGEEEEAADGK